MFQTFVPAACTGRCEGTAPPREQVVRLGSCSPQEGAPPLRPRVTFPSRGKSPKARQGLRPLESPEGDASLPLRCPHPLDRVSVTNPDRFATLSRWENRTLFLPKLYRGHTSCCQSVARQVPCPRGCRGPFYPQPIPLGQKAGESKGVLPLVPEVQEPGGSWRIFRSIYAATFLYARK